METKQQNQDSFDETQSIQVIKEMIHVSQKKIKNDGILFIVWGWLMFYNYVSSVALRNIVITHNVRKGFEYVGWALAIVAIAFSIYYVVKNNKKVTTYIGISLRYVWGSLIVCLSLTNILLFRGLDKATTELQYPISYLELQHPILMLFIAFAIVITGGILRYRLLILGGIVFAAFAYICSYLELDWQMVCEAAAWLFAFIIPGHYLYAQRKR